MGRKEKKLPFQIVRPHFACAVSTFEFSSFIRICFWLSLFINAKMQSLQNIVNQCTNAIGFSVISLVFITACVDVAADITVDTRAMTCTCKIASSMKCV